MTRPALALCLLALVLGFAAPAAGEEEPPPPPVLSVEALEIQPAAPAADTLCRLTVRIRNAGDRPVSSLHFAVSVGGRPLPVYGNQLFMQALPPGAVSEVRLYNFWTTETDRPAPADGKLAVEVTLDEARWLKISTDDDGVEVWEPLEPVPGLPVSRRVVLELAGARPAAPAGPGASSSNGAPADG